MMNSEKRCENCKAHSGDSIAYMCYYDGFCPCSWHHILVRIKDEEDRVVKRYTYGMCDKGRMLLVSGENALGEEIDTSLVLDDVDVGPNDMIMITYKHMAKSVVGAMAMVHG